jgi:hypothetical protein
MVSWGIVIFIGLWLVLRDVNAVTKAKLMGNPMLIHVIVIGSGLWIHGGSADGAMAAIVSVSTIFDGSAITLFDGPWSRGTDVLSWETGVV